MSVRTVSTTSAVRQSVREQEWQTRVELAACHRLLAHAEAPGKVGCMGFCWGGSISNRLAVDSKDLSAAVVYYGRSPESKDVPRIGVPLLLHYAVSLPSL